MEIGIVKVHANHRFLLSDHVTQFVGMICLKLYYIEGIHWKRFILQKSL